MLSQQENERLTQVSAGTPMGDLMRRYWHPVGPISEFERAAGNEVRVAGKGRGPVPSPEGGTGGGVWGRECMVACSWPGWRAV